jgi:hypothetical protein
MVTVLTAALGFGEPTEAGWDHAVELAETLWDGQLVALAWIRSLGGRARA